MTTFLSAAMLIALPAAADETATGRSILMISKAGTVEAEPIECTPQEASDLYDQTVAELQQALDDGTLQDPTILDYVIENEPTLSTDCQALIDLLIVDTIEQPPASNAYAETFSPGIVDLFAQNAVPQPVPGGGQVSGPRYPFRNIFGWEVGSGKVTITWASDGACRNKITGHTFVGSIPLGNCNAFLVGAKFDEECPATERCEEPTRECGYYQFKCKQVFRFRNLGTFTSGLDKICAPCPG